SWHRGPPEKLSINVSDYDSQGNCIRDSGEFALHEITYDKGLRKSAIKEIHEVDTGYTFYRYSNDSMQDTVISFLGGRVESQDLNRYDSTGRLIQTTSEDFSRHTIWISEQSYDDSGMTRTYRN